MTAKNKTFKFVEIEVKQDDDPAINPVEDYDMFGKMVFFHRRMNLGHESPSCSPDRWTRNWLQQNTKIDWDEIEDMEESKIWAEFEKINYAVPVYAFEHGGITIRCNSKGTGWDSWDSGQLGFTFASYDSIRKEFGKGKTHRLTSAAITRAEKCLVSEVDNYDDYLNGNVWGYIITDKDTGEELDSCWGFIGDESYCREEAESSAKHYEKELKAESKKIQSRLDVFTKVA